MRQVEPDGEWGDNFQAAADALIQGIKSLGVKDSATAPQLDYHRIGFVIGPDDRLISSQAVVGKHHFEMVSLKNGVALKVDESKTIIVLQPPVPASAPAVAQASNP